MHILPCFQIKYFFFSFFKALIQGQACLCEVSRRQSMLTGLHLSVTGVFGDGQTDRPISTSAYESTVECPASSIPPHHAHSRPRRRHNSSAGNASEHPRFAQESAHIIHRVLSGINPIRPPRPLRQRHRGSVSVCRGVSGAPCVSPPTRLPALASPVTRS